MAEVSVDEMVDAIQPDKPDDDEVDCNDVIQQARQNQDQDARDEGNDRRNVCGSDGHDDLLGMGLRLSCFKLIAYINSLTQTPT